MSTPAQAAPFSKNKFRVAGLVFDGDDVALIRRDRPGGSHYTTIGGNVEPGEDLLDALARELREELDLSMADASEPELLWVQDQRVKRPGPTSPPRKLHLVFRLFISSGARDGLATVEYDEQPDGSQEPGHIEWVNYRKTGRGFPLFPLIGEAIAALPSPKSPPARAYLPPVTDRNYTWV